MNPFSVTTRTQVDRTLLASYTHQVLQAVRWNRNRAEREVAREQWAYAQAAPKRTTRRSA